MGLFFEVRRDDLWKLEEKGKMDIRILFLQAVKASLEGKALEVSEEVSFEEWEQFFEIAKQHNVLPMVYESIYGSKAFLATGGPLNAVVKQQTMKTVFMQVGKQEAFKELYRQLKGYGLEPIVVKGCMVRKLYGKPDYRPSGDEDLYIPLGTYEVYKEALAKCGMTLAPWDEGCEDTNHEVTYVNVRRQLNVEIHKSLFDEKLSAFQGMNDLFTDAFEKSILVNVDDVAVRTMDHSDHMLFLILHAFKHFVTSGFGIRQVCDMVVYGNHYGREIDWDYLLKKCEGIQAEYFAAAIFDIGRKWLGFDWDKAGYPMIWQALEVDSANLLDDLVDAGIFGASNMSRKHSSNITLSAVNAEKQGEKAKAGIAGILSSVFLPLEAMEKRFPYLKKYPFLLPVAWAVRVWIYRKETKAGSVENRAGESIKIGKQRVELMKQYKILK